MSGIGTTSAARHRPWVTDVSVGRWREASSHMQSCHEASSGVARLGNTAYSDPMTGDETVANLLRRLRRERGASLRSVSAELGFAPSYLSRLERGVRRTTPQIARRMADYYGIPPDSFGSSEEPIPEDIVTILRSHPEELDRLRQVYGAETPEEPDDAEQ